MHMHDRVALAIMAAAEGARGGKEAYEYVIRILDRWQPGHANHRRRHFDLACCVVMCLCAVVPALFYSREILT